MSQSTNYEIMRDRMELAFCKYDQAEMIRKFSLQYDAAFLYRNMQKAGGEYEYVHTNSCFDVDLVIANARRKQLVSVDLEHVLLVAPADSREAEDYGSLPEQDCSGTGGEGTLYAMIYTAEGRKKKLLLRLDPKMCKSLRQWIPGKVK